MTAHKSQFLAPKSDNARLARLCGTLDENLRQIEQAYNATIVRRSSRFYISASNSSRAAEVRDALAHFYDVVADKTREVSIDDLQLGIVSLL